MIIRPIYNILLLPDVSYYFKKDFFSGFGGESIETGSDILFIFLKMTGRMTTIRRMTSIPSGWPPAQKASAKRTLSPSARCTGSISLTWRSQTAGSPPRLPSARRPQI